MYFSSAIAHSRFKWLGICFILTFIFISISSPNIGLTPNHNVDNVKTTKTSNWLIAPEIKESSIINKTQVTGLPVPLYYVDSAQCKIPFIDPFSEEVMKIFDPMEFEACSNESDLVTPIFDVNRKRYVLHINESLATQILNSSGIDYNCYYQEITRDVEQDGYNNPNIDLTPIVDYVKTSNMLNWQIAPGIKESIKETSEIVSSVVNKTKDTELPLPQFYVENAYCKIPFIDPFSEEVMKIFDPMEFEACSNESDLVTPIFDVNRKRYVLHINESLATQILNSSGINYICYYQDITRDAEQDGYNNLLPRIYFTQGYTVPMHVQGMIVSCHEAANASNVMQSDGYALVQYKFLPKDVPVKTEPRKPSVIMFGIDSMSRINLRRTMPKVYKFLTRSGWYEMQGYNKVGDNTFPNLMAILSGYTPESAKEKVCDTDKKGCFDQFPLIWKFFKAAGYLTAYGEDWTGLNTFNYVRPGFLNQPTDYYHRPFLKAFDSEMESWQCSNCSTKYCIGRRIQSSYVYDYGKEFARRYVDERPIWGLFWSTSFSHDSYALPSKMKDFILQYLLDFEMDGVLEQNIVIFFSDHGARFGTLSYLSSGFLEERLPMLFIYLPPWFRAQYPEYAQSLTANRNRLTSNYDLHNTLKHIIEIGGDPESPSLPKAYSCPKCQSLFYPVNETRSCDDAAIPEHYCTCQPYKRLRKEWSQRIAPLVIDHINEYLWSKNLSSLCANLTLSYIHKTEIKIGLDLNFHDELKMDVGFYRTKFKVQQNSADFFATVVFNNKTEQLEVDVETISRTNSYDEDATCINDKIAKLYCICLSNLRP